MKFKTLESYLKFRCECPFCSKPLYNKIETFLRGDDFIVKSKETLERSLKCDLSQKHYHGYDKEDHVKYGVTLFNNAKIGFKVKEDKASVLNYHYSPYQVSYNPGEDVEKMKQDFTGIFNRAHLHVISSCKGCPKEYFTTSLPLRADENGITEYTLYTETIKYKRFVVQNNFIDDKLQIYVDGSSAPPIETDRYDLNKDTGEKFITRIKVAVTFA